LNRPKNLIYNFDRETVSILTVASNVMLRTDLSFNSMEYSSTSDY